MGHGFIPCLPKIATAVERQNESTADARESSCASLPERCRWRQKARSSSGSRNSPVKGAVRQFDDVDGVVVVVESEVEVVGG